MRRSCLLLVIAILLFVTSIDAQPKYFTPKAFLELRATKTQLSLAECTNVRFSFNVYDDNKQRIHFYELQSQMSGIYKYFMPPDAFISPSRIDNIVGEVDSLNGKRLTRYTIYEGSICPIKAGDMVLPPLTLEMKHVSSTGEDSVVVEYKTKPVTIHTGAASNGLSTFMSGNNGLPVVGEFDLTEVIRPKEVGRGEAFEYSMLIDGIGNTTMMFPLSINRDKFDVDLVSSETMDFVSNDMLLASKTIKFEIVPKTGITGAFNLSSIIGPIRYFNPSKGSVDSLVSTRSIVIKDDVAATVNHYFPSDSSKTFIFLIDISQSMQVEDFAPTRLEYLKKELSALIDNGYSIEPILFASLARPLSKRTTPLKIADITHEFIEEKGTAIGDAIVFAVDYIKTSRRNYSTKILIAGDGDGTAGTIPAQLAAGYAQSKGFSIYPVGVGTPGLVPFGTDRFGNKHMISNTFSENDFKTLATKTGGRYVRAAPKANLLSLLQDVLEKP